ncbi:uncharacterized protein [Arachis hypogaea]|uniref:uncharacterized protein n=1 Tax=Arachis hypogaea TaxID=3818 RepID=UPI000DEC9AD3|nr:uncharacterized protein LOC112735834 isoform X2 [Arachis hypogaea]
MLPPPTHLQIWSQHLLHGRWPLMDVPCIQDRVFYFLARTYKIRIEAIEEPGIFQIRSSVKDLMLCYISILSTWLRWKATRFMLESLCNDLQMI